jgi:hypothetical protein
MCNLRVKVSETPGAADDAVFQNTFVSTEFDSSAISTMVDTWVSIEDEPAMLDCEVDELIERSLNNEPDDESDPEEGETESRAPLPKLGHQEAQAMIQSLLSHAVQNNITQGLQKYSKELDKRNLQKTRSQSMLTSFFGSKESQPPA